MAALSMYDKLELAVQDLQQKIEELVAFNANCNSAVALARHYADSRHIRDEAKQVVSMLSEHLESISWVRLPEAFASEGVKTVSLDDGRRVTMSSKLSASIIADKRADAYKWLDENGYGDIITPTVNANTLSSLAKSIAEEGRALPEDLFREKIVPTVSVTQR